MTLKESFSRLRSIKHDPCISIVLPTHRHAPDNAQDRVVLKNLIHDAKAQLLGRFGERDVKEILQALDEVEASHDHQHNRSSLAIFVSKDVCETLHLNIPAEAQLVIEDNFATRVLVDAMTTPNVYYILALSEKNVRLLEATLNQAHESSAAHFPLANGHQAVSHKQRANWEKVQDKQTREYFEHVDERLAEVMDAYPMPLVLAGTENTLGHFLQVTRHGDRVLTTFPGNFEQATPGEVGKVAWPYVHERLRELQAASLAKLEEARHQMKLAVGVAEVYATAKEGRGEILFCEKSYFQPAIMEGGHISLRDDSTATGYVSDVVDEIVETVLDRGGQVRFVDEGMLGDIGNPIALVLRY